jgi:hypothetical protein
MESLKGRQGSNRKETTGIKFEDETLEINIFILKNIMCNEKFYVINYLFENYIIGAQTELQP